MGGSCGSAPLQRRTLSYLSKVKWLGGGCVTVGSRSVELLCSAATWTSPAILGSFHELKGPKDSLLS